MSLTTRWDGSILTPANPNNERTTQLGTFQAINKINTYYPLPSAYALLVPVLYPYKVPTKFAGRPDLIANEVYQATDMWWVILWANGIVDPFAQPLANSIINIIDIKSLMALLG